MSVPILWSEKELQLIRLDLSIANDHAFSVDLGANITFSADHYLQGDNFIKQTNPLEIQTYLVKLFQE